MQFERYLSGYEQALKLGRCPPKQSWPDFFEAQLRSLDPVKHNLDVVQSYNLVLMEERWYTLGKPYYKVWPTMVDLFTTTRLDIPVEALKAPYGAFAIYLPSTPILTFQSGGSEWWVHSMMVGASDFTFRGDTNEQVDRATLTVWVDVGERSESGMSVFSHLHANFHPGKTIEECFGQRHPSADVGLVVPDEILFASLRLAVAVCFLASGGNRVVERDILSRHLDAYRQEAEDSPKRRAWEEKSARYGLGGWHIGRDRQERGLSFAHGVNYAEAVRDGQSGRSLLYTHWRGAHFHTVRHGQGREQVKVIWMEPIQVRKDLPPKPLNR